MTDDRLYSRQNKVSAKQRFKLMWEQWLEPQESPQEGSRPWTQSGIGVRQILLLPILVNKVALGHSYAHSLTHCPLVLVLSHHNGRIGQVLQRPLGLQNWNYSLSGPLYIKFAKPWSKRMSMVLNHETRGKVCQYLMPLAPGGRKPEHISPWMLWRTKKSQEGKSMS